MIDDSLAALGRWSKAIGSKLGLGKAIDNSVVVAGGILVVTFAIVVVALLFQSPSDTPTAQAPVEVSPAEVMKAGDLPEIVIGKPEAKITIVEYASMTCPHCANFHTKVFPQLKAKYIDTGTARLVFREFPLDNLALSAAMLARCVGGEGAEPFIGDLFKRQSEWAVRAEAAPKLFEVAKQAGFTQASFEKCLNDQELYQKILGVRQRAEERFGVRSTPTFFVNGQRLGGTGSFADFEKALEPLLKSQS
jgi:protein-disulfide isomerase